MQFCGPLIVVSDIERSKSFYKTLLDQKVKFDFGENIMFESGFSIQLKPHYAKMIEINESAILAASNNFELYFEEEHFDNFVKKAKSRSDIIYIQYLVEHSWGQRVTRFYDPDKHIIEVGESMKSVIKRLLHQGLTIEEAVQKSQHTLEFVKSCIDEK